MTLKIFNPITPGTRGLVLVDRKDLWKGKPWRSLTVGLNRRCGRNNEGRVTMKHRGGGHKRNYRIIDFKRNKLDINGTVERFEYDPNRSAFIALIKYEDQEMSYILAPQKLNIGDQVVASEKADIKPGNNMLVKNIPVGTIIHNVELKPGKGAQVARSAGCYAQIISRLDNYIQIRLSSREVRIILNSCRATIGSVSNPDNKNTNLGKAGRNRWLGKRPHVRGVAMNPFDHPHGGGNGKTAGGRNPVTPYGVPTKGYRTRNNKRTDFFIVNSRHKSRKK